MRGNFGIEFSEDAVGSRGDLLRVGVGEHSDRHPGYGALEEVDVNGRRRWGVQAVLVNVTDDAHDGQETNVAIHVSELDCLPNGFLAGPARASQRFADNGDVR